MSSQLEPPFLKDVLRQYLTSLRRREVNNYDASRYSFDGVDRSNVFDFDYHHENLCFFTANHEEFRTAWSLLQDDASRELFVELILWRLAGHLHVKLSTNTERYWKFQEEALAVPSTPSHFSFKGIFGPLRHYERYPFCDRTFAVDCWPVSLASVYLMKQYFFHRGNVQISPEVGEQVVDAGALFGDTALAFATAVGEKGRVYAFDPLGSHGKIIFHNIAQNGLQDRILFFPVGLGEFANEVPGPVKEEEIVNPGFNLQSAVGIDRIPIRTIDGLVATGAIERVDFLKMDIEGSELAALRGAEKTLRQFKPKLAISVYHKFSDLFDIPSFIHSLGLGYRFYLSHYTIHAEETVLYADSRSEDGRSPSQ
jgi:FkbM family methyltransferase